MKKVRGLFLAIILSIFACRPLIRHLSLLLFALCLAAPAVAVAQPAPFVPARDPQAVAFAPGGSLIATAVSGQSDGQFPPRPHPQVRKCAVVYLWDTNSGKRVWRQDSYGDFTELKFSPDGSLLGATRLYASRDGVPLDEVRLFNIASGQVERVLDRCHAFDFSKDGKSMAVASRTKCVIYDVATGERKQEIEELGGAVSLTYGKTALYGIVQLPAGYVIRKWDLANNFLDLESLPQSLPFYRVVLSPDEQQLATGHEGVVLVRAADTLQPLFQLPLGARGRASPIFSPDRKLIAAGNQATGDVTIWDLESREELHRYTVEKGSFRPFYSRSADELFRPESDPQRFAFSLDSSAFLTGAFGGILRAVNDGRELLRVGE